MFQNQTLKLRIISKTEPNSEPSYIHTKTVNIEPSRTLSLFQAFILPSYLTLLQVLFEFCIEEAKAFLFNNMRLFFFTNQQNFLQRGQSLIILKSCTQSGSRPINLRQKLWKLKTHLTLVQLTSVSDPSSFPTRQSRRDKSLTMQALVHLKIRA